jgi:polysaccharide biosynthesis/export protein
MLSAMLPLLRPVGPLALVVAACIGPVAGWAAAQTAPSGQELGAPQVVPDYQIGPQDILKISVYTHDDLTQTVIVQNDGTFTYPHIGRIKASDHTPKELETKIAKLLAQGFIRNPQVTVVVQEYRSKTVFVVGEVARPGTYPLTGDMRLVEVLSKAGPMTANASTEILVVRPAKEVSGPVLPTEVEAQEKSAEVLKVNIKEVESGDISKNLLLRPNDTVFVPQAPKVFVSGEVRNPGAYSVAPGATVRQVISMAGGFTDRASQGKIRVVRTLDGKAKETKIDLDSPVEPGDSVVVKPRLF